MESSSNVEQVGGNATTSVTVHTKTNLPIDKNGYLYVFVSNETTNLDVFFDNLQVTHIKGPILEETHYYPFGLTMAGISSKAAGTLENKKNKFQNQELNSDLDVNFYEFKWRSYDPQIGRFIQIDPLADEYVYNSTYAFSENKVTVHVELEGLEAQYIFEKAKKEVAQTYQSAANWLDRTFSFGSKTKSETPITPKNGSTGNNIVVESTTETRTNVGEGMNYLIQNNTLEGYKGPVVKTETKTDVKVEKSLEVKTAAGTVKTTASVDQNGKTTVGGDGTIKTRTGIDVGVNASQSSNGDKKLGASVSATVGGTTVKTNVTGTSNNNAVKNVELNVTLQQKVDNTRVSQTYFIKVSGN